jgi:hypothetical protein
MNSDLNEVSGFTTTNIGSPYAYSVGSEEVVTDLLKDWINKSLVEEDKDKTFSKLITSIVIDKMYELSEMSEEELVETLLFKKLSDSFSNRLSEIELSINQLRNDIQLLKWKDENLRYTQYTQQPNTSSWEPAAITGSDLINESFTLTKNDFSSLTTSTKEDKDKKSIISKIKKFH